MVVIQQVSKRKNTGGMNTAYRKMRKHEIGEIPTKTVIGALKLKKAKSQGGSIKLKLCQTEYANVFDSEAKSAKKAKITDVLENAANPHFVRQKVITKGAIIQTDSGKAKVTSRPGQNGIVNAVKME